MSDNYQTRITLLRRAQDPNNHKAWEEFTATYQPFIFHILHRMNVSINDFDDLVQEVLLRLWKKLPDFDPERAKFRSWFSAMIRNLALDYLRAQSRKSSRQEALENNENDFGHLDSMTQPEVHEIIEKEWKVYVSNLAFENIKKIFSGHAVEVLELSLQGYSNEEISQKLEVKLESVKVLKSRVKKRFMDELKQLIRDLESL